MCFFASPAVMLAGLLALLVAVAPTARGDTFTTATAAGDTRLRKAPRADSAILTVIPGGSAVAAGDCHGGWCRVSWKGQEGYAASRHLGFSEKPWWRGPAAEWPGAHGSSPWTGKAGREHEEGKKQEGRENGHDDSAPEHGWVLEIGAAGEWSLNGGRPNFGGTVAAEVEPIENWLELELGLTSLATAGRTELSGDLLFKKPFRLSPTVEFMAGAGPSLSRTFSGPDRGNSWSTEFALDWMFWPAKDIGWFIEPTWSVNPRNGQQSAAVSIGVLIGFPK
jgi:hypothetical protein